MDGELGKYIKTIRQRRDLTQTEAANAAGISHTQWVRLEHGGGGTKPETLERIADALQIEKGTIPHIDLYRLAGLYPPFQPQGGIGGNQVVSVETTYDTQDPMQVQPGYRLQTFTPDDTPDEYAAFDLSDDPVIQALSTGMEQQAIAEVSKLVLDGARETVAEYLKRKRAENSTGKEAK